MYDTLQAFQFNKTVASGYAVVVPRPVSAMMRFFAQPFASKICPIVLLILCAPYGKDLPA